MKRTLLQVFHGQSSLTSGTLALLILGLIVLGCTCNQDLTNSDDKGTANSNSAVAEREEPDTKSEPEFEKADASEGEIPSEAELQKMVREDIMAFDKALKDEDFKGFYDRTSKLWQRQTTPEELKKKFQAFIDGNADLSGVEDLEADFSPDPKIDDSKRIKVLEVEGTYPTKPRTSTFELKYIPEEEDWKLISFFVQTTVYKKQ